MYDFYKELLKYKPFKKYKRKYLEHMYYMTFLTEIKKAINEEKHSTEVIDFRIAIIYEIAKIKYKLENNGL